MLIGTFCEVTGAFYPSGSEFLNFGNIFMSYQRPISSGSYLHFIVKGNILMRARYMHSSLGLSPQLRSFGLCGVDPYTPMGSIGAPYGISRLPGTFPIVFNWSDAGVEDMKQVQFRRIPLAGHGRAREIRPSGCQWQLPSVEKPITTLS